MSRLTRPEIATFEAHGPRRAEFPMDMLRWASCWPARGEDAAAIHRSLLDYDQRSEERLTIRLCMNLFTWDHMQIQIAQRFGSFGWTVEAVEVDA